MLVELVNVLDEEDVNDGMLWFVGCGTVVRVVWWWWAMVGGGRRASKGRGVDGKVYPRISNAWESERDAGAKCIRFGFQQLIRPCFEGSAPEKGRVDIARCPHPGRPNRSIEYCCRRRITFRRNMIRYGTLSR